MPVYFSDAGKSWVKMDGFDSNWRSNEYNRVQLIDYELYKWVSRLEPRSDDKIAVGFIKLRVLGSKIKVSMEKSKKRNNIWNLIAYEKRRSEKKRRKDMKIRCGLKM